MFAGLTIRDEAPGDAQDIHEVTRAAFAPMAYSDGVEPAIVDALRKSGDLAISLVAVLDGAVVGHVAFSRVGFADWYALGPVSVHPDRQGIGIGSALIRAGLERLRQLNAAGCVLVGDPGYYARFGFQGDCGLTYSGVPPKFVQALVFHGASPTGEITFAPAFDLDG